MGDSCTEGYTVQVHARVLEPYVLPCARILFFFENKISRALYVLYTYRVVSYMIYYNVFELYKIRRNIVNKFKKG